jgi:hypothetical protein
MSLSCDLLSFFSLFVSLGDGETKNTVCAFHWGLLESRISFSFILPPSYPKTPPIVSASSNFLKREKTDAISVQLANVAQKISGENMMMELIMWIQDTCPIVKEEELQQCPSNSSHPPPKESSSTTILLHLDHMKMKAKYSKTIKKWTGELGLCGCLIFLNKYIFIILQGSKKDIKVSSQNVHSLKL